MIPPYRVPLDCLIDGIPKQTDLEKHVGTSIVSVDTRKCISEKKIQADMIRLPIRAHNFIFSGM